MKLFATLYLDEDVNPLIAKLLGARGYDVVTTRDENMLTRPDPKQLTYAVSQERAILTHNRRDFEILHQGYLAENRIHFGIIIASRRSPYEIADRVAALLDQLTADEITNQLLYV